MPRTGRPPKPIEQKRLTGNPGKRPLPATVVAIRPAITQQRALEVPTFETGEDLIAYLVAEGADRWIGRTDGARVRLLLNDWNEQARLSAWLAEHGDMYESESRVSGVQYHPWPQVMQLNRVLDRIERHLVALGLDTASRSRLGVAEVKAQKSKLELLMMARPTGTGSATG